MPNSSMGSVIPESAVIAQNATIGPRVVLAGDGIVLRDNVRLDAACVIGEGITVGQGAWVRAGAVVLRSVPANAIVEGNPAQIVGYIDGGNSDTRPDPRLLDIHGFDHLECPARVPLDVGDSALYLMRRFTDARGHSRLGRCQQKYHSHLLVISRCSTCHRWSYAVSMLTSNASNF